MKKQAYTVPEMLAALVGMVVLVVALFPALYEGRESSEPIANCQSNLKQIGLGIRQYVQDYDEKYPLVRSGREGWMEIVQPYIKSEEVFQCPEESKGEVLGTTDYFYNARLSNQSEASLTRWEGTLMNGDGASNSPTTLSISQLPKAWTQSKISPALRHLNGPNNGYSEDEAHKDGANYCYTDGHVKWLRPENVTNKKPASGITTFELS